MFASRFARLDSPAPIVFPDFSATRVMMMPVILGDLRGVPAHYRGLVSKLYRLTKEHLLGQTGYLTIDERALQAGQTLRRPGLHVDGYYHGRCGPWGGSWGPAGNGMLTVSSTAHCRAYLGDIEGEPGPEGECEHLVMPNEGELFAARQVYWVDGACVHESTPVTEDTQRQFVRLSMPSKGPWFEGYTVNPDGVMPAAAILPAREEFMRG